MATKREPFQAFGVWWEVLEVGFTTQFKTVVNSHALEVVPSFPLLDARFAWVAYLDKKEVFRARTAWTCMERLVSMAA